ncbi:MAG TPA: hypothetical protein VEJ38_15395 [Candidatus Acidoferrales bacterium]|nr:hypothetical protein [Candidatus Acidoferrales bacterium]
MHTTDRSVERPTEIYYRNSIRAYMEGLPGCDLEWIARVLSRAKITARALLASRFSRYESTDRYRMLKARL